MNILRIAGKEGREFIRENHYSHSCHNGPICFGLYQDDALVGVVAFATPCSEAVRCSVFGAEHKDAVTELHRLFTFDDLPGNTESWFVSRALQMLLAEKPGLRGIISYADGTEGHVGYIYQALNFQYCGTTGSKIFYRDAEGRLRHPRQGGVNIDKEEATKRGWDSERRDAKYRYILVIGPDRRARRKFKSLLRYESLPYPKRLTLAPGAEDVHSDKTSEPKEPK